MALEVEKYKGEKPEEKGLSQEDLGVFAQILKNQNALIERALSNPGGIDNESLAKLLEAAKGQVSKSSQFEFNQANTLETVDVDDYLEEKDWKVFICHNYIHVIVDDIRAGVPVAAPLKPMFFEYDFTRRQQSGTSTNIMQVCKYVCKSKKELKFLLNHSQYGVRFFDSLNSLTTMDGRRNSIMQTVYAQVNNYTPDYVVKYCASEGLPVTNDVKQMKASIAEHMTNAQMKKIKSEFQLSVEQQFLEAKNVGMQSIE